MPKIVDHDARRLEVIAALWRVVEREGAEAVSVRSVAAEAGLSRAGMTYYFDSQAQLLALAIEQSVATVTSRILALDLFDCTVDTAVDAFVAMLPDTRERQSQAEVWLLLLGQARNDVAAQQVLSGLNATVRAGIVDVLTALAGDRLDIDQSAATLHAMIDGVSVAILTDPHSATVGSAREILHAYVTTLVSHEAS